MLQVAAYAEIYGTPYLQLALSRSKEDAIRVVHQVQLEIRPRLPIPHSIQCLQALDASIKYSIAPLLVHVCRTVTRH